MKVLVVIGHQNTQQNSFCHAIAAAVMDELKAGRHEVIYHDLYREGFNPVLAHAEVPKDAALDPVVQRHGREVAEAGGYVVVHPNWWGQPPAMLKGWVNRVFRQGVVYEFGEKGAVIGRLAGKTAVVFTTSNTPRDMELERFGDPLENLWKTCVFQFCGVTDFLRRNFESIIISTPQHTHAVVGGSAGDHPRSLPSGVTAPVAGRFVQRSGKHSQAAGKHLSRTQGMIMNVHDAIKNRRSVREYSSRPIPDEAMQRLRDSLRLAPSACNLQPWRFLFVTDEQLRRKLAEAANGQTFVAKAPLIVVACGYPDVAYKQMGGYGNSVNIDVAIALDHLMLAAVAEGLGTCWIGAFDEGRVKKLLEAPERVKVVAMTPVGFPASADLIRPVASAARKPEAEVFSFERYRSPRSLIQSKKSREKSRFQVLSKSRLATPSSVLRKNLRWFFRRFGRPVLEGLRHAP